MDNCFLSPVLVKSITLLDVKAEAGAEGLSLNSFSNNFLVGVDAFKLTCDTLQATNFLSR